MATASGERKVCVVVGVGPGNGEALARAFAADGFRVALIARDAAKVAALSSELDGLPVPCDVTDLAAVEAAFTRISAELGPVHTVLWNVGSGVFGDLDAVGVEALELSWRTNTLALFVAARQVVPGMRARKEGNILITGATASLRGKPFTTAFAAGKAAQRSLAQSLARQLGPQGIHVALVIVDGMVDLPSTRARMPGMGAEKFIDPKAVAATMLALAHQPRSAWTFELDVRPHVESW